MSRLLARILLAVLMIPCACMVYLVVFVLRREWQRSIEYTTWEEQMRIAYIVSGVLTWTFVAAWWYLLWHKSVRWTGWRVGLTLLLVLACVTFGVFVGFVINSFQGTFGDFVGSVAAPLAWLVGSVVAWRESASERAARATAANRDAVVCPTCGYNLTGLTEPRCPECGARYTLDQLMAAQPGRMAAATVAELES
jgi:hypothetical protein